MIKNWIERILARFGYVPYRPQPIELIVFRNASEARGAGFRGERHPDHEHLRAWWPSMGMRGLCGAPPQRVTVSEGMSAYRTPEGRVYDLLRCRQMVWGDRAIWVELG